MNILKTTELYTLRGSILYSELYLNKAIIKIIIQQGNTAVTMVSLKSE